MKSAPAKAKMLSATNNKNNSASLGRPSDTLFTILKFPFFSTTNNRV
jgi:hypothetical protein